jgi:RNA polymerase sigma-70 factor (ECF subfamily)
MSTAAMPDTMTASSTGEFDDLFRKHCDLVHATAYGVTGSYEDAEDIVQIIFLRILRRGLPPDFGKNPKAYLYRAAVNQSLTTIQSRRRRPMADTEPPDLPAPLDESAHAEEVHRQLYEAIAKLKPKNAEILILRYVHNYSDAQIAKFLGTSRGAVALSLYRSRGHLKKFLSASQGERS